MTTKFYFAIKQFEKKCKCFTFCQEGNDRINVYSKKGKLCLSINLCQFSCNDIYSKCCNWIEFRNRWINHLNGDSCKKCSCKNKKEKQKEKPKKIIMKVSEQNMDQIANQLKDKGCDDIKILHHVGMIIFNPNNNSFSSIHDSMMNETLGIKNLGIENMEEDQEAQINVFTTQSLPLDDTLWGLDKIDQPVVDVCLLDHAYNYSYDGTGVDIYIMDSGVIGTHVEFIKLDNTSRVLEPINIIPPPNRNPRNDDPNGHGTFVASVAAGKTVGVAKNANIIPVNIADRKGVYLNSDAITGINAVIASKNSRNLPSVLNMSFGSAFSSAVNSAVQLAYDNGILPVAAAGNDNLNSVSGISPASSPNAITVAATNINNQKWNLSNYGTGVDIYAPGEQILGAYKGTGQNLNNTYIIADGTSASAPFVSGVAALYFQQNPMASLASCSSAILTNAVNLTTCTPTIESPQIILNTRFLINP